MFSEGVFSTVEGLVAERVPDLRRVKMTVTNKGGVELCGQIVIEHAQTGGCVARVLPPCQFGQQVGMR